MCAWLALRAAGRSYEVPLAEVGPVLEGLTLPGRFQRMGNLIFDVAHNPAGAAVLAETVKSVAPRRPITVLLAVLGDKDWRGMLSHLSTIADRIVVSMPPTAPSDRRWKLQEVREFAALNRLPVEPIEDFDDALHSATNAGGTTLITGSFHTVGDAMLRLQVNPLAR
jgi:dihydrofolate synthase/folylpolyglutamate synthase